MKKSGFGFSLPDTPPVRAEDLISSEILQGFVVSSKPFSRGRKQTHFQDAQIYSQQKFFQNLSAMDTKHQKHFYQCWKKPRSVISTTDPVSNFCSDSFHFAMKCQSWLQPLPPRCGRNHSPITLPKYCCADINQSSLKWVWEGETRNKALCVLFHGWTQEFRMTQMTSS